MVKAIASTAAALALLAASVATPVSSTPPMPPTVVATRTVVAAPGRIEGRQQSVGVSSALDGVLAGVLAREGDRVTAGQIVARLDCRDVEADLGAADARGREAVANRQRLLRGGRDDARAVAVAQVQAADARLSNARLARERASRLFLDDQIIPRSALDAAERDEQVAVADLEAARQQSALVKAEPLAEERAAADATVDWANWTRASLAARLEKCAIRSPIDGIVLRRSREPGERAIDGPEHPILTIADVSSLRVRIEVDERDVAAVRVGQRVRLSAEAFEPDTPLAVVSSILPTMGRRRVQTGDPAEKSDRDILEVIADIRDRDPRLVVGLRVTAMLLDR